MPLSYEPDDDLLSIRKHPISFIGLCLATLLAPQNLIITRFYKERCNGLDCQRELGYWEGWQSFVRGSARGEAMGLYLCSVCRKNGNRIPSYEELRDIRRERRKRGESV